MTCTCIESVLHNTSFISLFTATCFGSNCEQSWGLYKCWLLHFPYQCL